MRPFAETMPSKRRLALFMISATLCAEYSLSTSEPLEWIIDMKYSNLLPKNNSAAEIQQVLSVQECAGLCSTNTWCSSFTFSPSSCGEERGVCRCYRFVFTELTVLAHSDGTEYYRISDSSCPHEKEYFRSRQDNLCLRMFQGGRWNRAQAKTKCEQNHGRLPILDTRSKNVWAFDVMKFNLVDQKDCSVYLGAYAQELKTFYWDTTKIRVPNSGNASFWGPNEPNGHKSENCLILLPARTGGSEWHDNMCTYAHKAVLCEYVN